MIPEEIIAEVRDRTDIAQVIGDYVTLTRSGAQLRGLCPFHTERTPSFYVYPQKQFYICYGCGKKGDVFSFLMEQQARSFMEVLQELAQRAGVDLPETGISPAARSAARSEKERLLRVNELACEFFVAQYGKAPEARRYVEGRGISAATAATFRLGFAPAAGEALTQHLLRKQVPSRLAEEAGLIAKSSRGPGYYDRFRGRVMFPVMDGSGAVIAFSGRLLDPEAKAAKYINSPETPVYRKGRNLFGLHAARSAIREQARAVLVEGNFDVVQLHERGLTETVAPLGTALTEQQVLLLRRQLGDGHVVVLFDGDDAGRKAAERTVGLLVSQGMETRIARCPAGDDPDTVARRDGADAVRRLVDRATPGLEYLIEDAAAQAGDSVEGRVRALRALAPTLRLVKDTTARDLYGGQVATALGIDQRAVGRAMRLAQVAAEEPGERPAAPRQLTPALDRELRLLALLSDHPELRAEAAEAEPLLTQETVRSALEALVDAPSTAVGDEVLLGALPEELHHSLAERILAGSFLGDDFGAPDGRRALQEIMATLQREAQLGAVRDVDDEIARAVRNGDEPRKRALAQRKLELLRQRHGIEKR